MMYQNRPGAGNGLVSLVGVAVDDAERVFAQIDAVFSDAATCRIGWMPIDGLYFFDVLPEEIRVAIGERDKMRLALVTDRRITANDLHELALRVPAPRGFAWFVVDWGDFITTGLHTLDGAS